MLEYRKSIGRVSVAVSREGMLQHDYGHGAEVSYVSGWNDICPTVRLTMSVEELRDLRYLLDRAIIMADAAEAKSHA